MNKNTSQNQPNFPANTFLGYRCHDFQFGENGVTVVEPHNPAPGRRWIWAIEGMPFPDFNLAMLERGWWAAIIKPIFYSLEGREK